MNFLDIALQARPFAVPLVFSFPGVLARVMLKTLYLNDGLALSSSRNGDVFASSLYANLIAVAILGLILRPKQHRPWFRFLAIGFCGSLSTYSAWQEEVSLLLARMSSALDVEIVIWKLLIPIVASAALFVVCRQLAGPDVLNWDRPVVGEPAAVALIDIGLQVDLTIPEPIAVAIEENGPLSLPETIDPEGLTLDGMLAGVAGPEPASASTVDERAERRKDGRLESVEAAHLSSASISTPTPTPAPASALSTHRPASIGVNREDRHRRRSVVVVPICLLLVIALCIAFSVGFAYGTDHSQTWAFLLSMAFAPIGCLLRIFIFQFNPLNVSVAIPWGTIAANLLGSIVSAVMQMLSCRVDANNKVAQSILTAVADGFCGALTTFSTFIAELFLQPPKLAWKYGLLSIILTQFCLLWVNRFGGCLD